MIDFSPSSRLEDHGNPSGERRTTFSRSSIPAIAQRPGTETEAVGARPQADAHRDCTIDIRALAGRTGGRSGYLRLRDRRGRRLARTLFSPSPFGFLFSGAGFVPPRVPFDSSP